MPTFLPQYTTAEGRKTYKMQVLIRATNGEIQMLIEKIKSEKIDRTQIECWETMGHFNILVWIISENPIDLQFVQDRIQAKPGVMELRASILLDWVDFYQTVSLQHIVE